MPEDVKRYRFNLLEKIRLRTIEKIKKKRNEIIQKEKFNLMNESIIGFTPKKLKRNFEINLPENNSLYMTFSEKMSSMIKREKESLNKLKIKQKQNIDYMIEQQVKADMINYRCLEKEKRFKDNKEKIKREIAEKEMRTQMIKEEIKQKQLTNVKEIMNRKIIKINIKHDKAEKKRNILLEEKNKKREELIKAYNHRSQLDLFKQHQEKILFEKKLNNEKKDRQILERLKNIKKIRKELNSKMHERSAEIQRRNSERKEEQLTRFIKKINLKHSNYFQRMKEYYKEMEEKSRIFKMHNTKKQKQHKYLFKSIEEARKRKIDDYFIDTLKKDQNVIICKLMKTQKILNRKTHENEISDLVLEHKQEIEMRNKKKINDYENKMEELDNRIINFKKEEGHKVLLKSQESFVKQAEKDIENQRNQRMKEYKNELKEKKLEEKEKMFDIIKNEKLKFRNEAKKLSFELKNEKISLLNKFNKLFKGKSTISCDLVKKFYPGDEELYEKIRDIQNRYKMNCSSDKREKVQNLTARNEHKIPKNILWKKKEESIEKKVQQFRIKLREAIKKDIEQERINESRRIKNYDNAESIKDKHNIEQKNKIERYEFGKKMMDLNDNIEKYVDDYRKKLVKENGYS